MTQNVAQRATRLGSAVPPSTSAHSTVADLLRQSAPHPCIAPAGISTDRLSESQNRVAMICPPSRHDDVSAEWQVNSAVSGARCGKCVDAGVVE